MRPAAPVCDALALYMRAGVSLGNGIGVGADPAVPMATYASEVAVEPSVWSRKDPEPGAAAPERTM